MGTFPLGEVQPLRLEWWGGEKDVTEVGLLRPLLGRSVERVEHATLDERDRWDGTDEYHLAPDNVVFTLRDGERWELLDSQNSDMQLLLFKKIAGDAELITSGDLQREPGDRPFTVALEGPHSPFPWTVVGITEVWTTHEGQISLQAAILWGDQRGAPESKSSQPSHLAPLLAIYVSYDSFWIRSAREVLSALERDLFHTRNMFYRFYDRSLR